MATSKGTVDASAKALADAVALIMSGGKVDGDAIPKPQKPQECAEEGCEELTAFKKSNGKPRKYCAAHTADHRGDFQAMLHDKAEAEYGPAWDKAEAAAKRAKGTGDPVTVDWTVTVNALGYFLAEHAGADFDKASKTVTISFPSKAAEAAARKAIDATGKLA